MLRAWAGRQWACPDPSGRAHPTPGTLARTGRKLAPRRGPLHIIGAGADREHAELDAPGVAAVGFDSTRAGTRTGACRKALGVPTAVLRSSTAGHPLPVGHHTFRRAGSEGMRQLSPAARAGARATALSLLVLVVATCDRQGPTSILERRAVDANTRRQSAAVALPGATDPQVFIGAGDIGICGSANDQKTATVIDGLLVSAPDATVFTLGDNAYPNGSATDFSECYTATWGRHIGRTFPSAGERDYNTAGAAGYFGYFGEAAGDPAKGYYSYDIGASWHVVVPNSKLPTTAGSAQE